jgi:hypothetical protein
MRNKAFTETTLIRKALSDLEESLPTSWGVDVLEEPLFEQPRARMRPDATITVRDPEGRSQSLIVEAKSKLDAIDADRAVEQLRRWSATEPDVGLLIVAPFLSATARGRLVSLGVNYFDATGNARLTLDSPALFLKSSGAEKNPWPEQRTLMSLRGRVAGRAVRGLIDFQPPFGIRELATLSKTSAPSLSRVAELLEREAIVVREKSRGQITSVDWKALLERWSVDYSLTRSNNASMFLDPRGINGMLRKLKTSSGTYAVTGSLASSRVAPIAEPRLATIYVRDTELFASQLDLRPSDTGGNVMLLEPFDEVVFDRGPMVDEVRYAAPSQVAVDLMTGPGRGPSEAEALLKWMAENEDTWRLPPRTS